MWIAFDSARSAIIVTIIGTAIYSVAYILIAPFALFSFMIFDSSGPEENPLGRVFFYSIWAVVASLLTVSLPWLLIGFKKYRWAVFSMIAQLIPVIFFVTVYVVLDIYCQGKFACN